jgi:CBS domain containing-hemolysin-like protein
MPEGEYETLAGFVLDRLGRIPDVGDQFSYDGWLIEIVEMDRRRVARLRLTAPERSVATAGSGAES